VNTTMQIGGALGLAVLTTLSTKRTENRLGDGASQASALTSAITSPSTSGPGLWRGPSSSR